MPRLKGFRYPREIIAFAVWAYHRFAMSTADVEDLLAERGVIVSREAVRLWVNRFGRHFADCIRRNRSRPNDKWHLDEVVITIRGKKLWLWRAIDANGPSLACKHTLPGSGCARYTCSNAPKRQGCKTLLRKTDHPIRRAEGRNN
jgi:transposase-like protein